MPELGHMVLYVRDLETSLSFYRDLIGLQECGKIFNNRAAMLTGGRTHHELLLIEVGDAPGPLEGKRLGLYHIGWKIGEHIDELKAMYRKLQEQNYPVDGMSDHTVSQSIYLRDPDGNEAELYIDNTQYDWRNDDEWMEAPVKPLNLD